VCHTDPINEPFPLTNQGGITCIEKTSAIQCEVTKGYYHHW